MSASPQAYIIYHGWIPILDVIYGWMYAAHAVYALQLFSKYIQITPLCNPDPVNQRESNVC